MSEFILFGMVVALGVALRRAFVRIDQLERAQSRSASLPLSALRPAEGSNRRLQPEGGSSRVEPQGGSNKVAPERGRDSGSETLEDDEPASLETTIGTQWLLYVGVIAIVIGVAYFEKLAIDNRWIGETARVIQGAVLGLALTYAGVRFGRAGYRLYGQMITGGGGAILYVSTFAAFNFYHLIDRPLAFGLMVAITAMVAWLADREQSQGLALFAAGGGFGTPFLLPGTIDAQIALFGYDAILIGGTVLLSRRRDWPVLNIVSYLFTLLTVAAWVDRFYRPEKFLATELFITLFCAMFLYILYVCRKAAHGGSTATVAVLWTAPAAYYAASIALLVAHPTAMLVWLVALMLVGAIVSTRFAAGAGLAVWAAVTVPLLAWIQVHAGSSGWLVSGLATVAGVYATALAAQLYCALEREDFGPFGIVWLHANGLLMFAAAYFLIQADHVAVAGAFAATFAVWHWALAAGLAARRRDHAIHFAALGFTLMSIAIAIEFDGPAVTVGWAAQGAVIVALGLRERRDWLRFGGLVLSVIAAGRAVELLVSVAPAGHVVFLNARAAAGAFVAGLCYLLAWLFYRDPVAPQRKMMIAASVVAAQVIVLALLTGEINAYWSPREWDFERQVMTSVMWGLFATALIVIGLWKRYAPIRYLAIVVFTITIAKVFFVDLASLDRVYRVISIIGLGVMLLVTSYLYNRARGTGSTPAASTTFHQ